MYKIVLNGIKEITGIENSIFHIASSNNITLNHSCLTGRCSECKVKVISGKFEMNHFQEGLTEQEIKQGYCLSCITKPLSNLILEEVNFFDGILPNIKTIPAKITSIEFISENVAKLVLRTPPNKTLNFISGQYVSLSVNGIKRSYSISSTPSDLNIEFLIKNYINGQFSNYLFNRAKINDRLTIEGPFGTYLLPKKILPKLIFLSTGTGIAPNISILTDAIARGLVKNRQITIIHGQRFKHEHIYHLEEKFPGIEIIKTTSRENIDGHQYGYVQDVLKIIKIEPQNTQVFACGNPNMIKESKEYLINIGLKEKNFKSDIFVKSN